MTTDEDARAAARRIVEQVLASQAEQVLASQAEQVLASQAEQVLASQAEQVLGSAASEAPDHVVVADAVVDDAVTELTGEHSVVRAEQLVEDAVAVIAADANIAVEVAPGTPATPVAAATEPPVFEPRARARALVAEVLTAHEEAAKVAVPASGSGGAARPGSSAPSTSSRVRARELVAAALAEEQERDAEERAHAEAEARAVAEEAAAQERERVAASRIEAARRAEEERAAAARARAEELDEERRAEADRVAAATERARAEADRDAAEEDERRQWADADRDAATATTPMSVHGYDADRPSAVPDVPEVAEAQGDGDPDATRPVSVDATGPDRTVPLSIAELAASGHVTEQSPPEQLDDASVGDDGGGQATDARATAVLATETETEAPAPADAELAPTQGVLEATVEPEAFEPRPRTGRWLIASIVGAITLAIVFPLAIRALLQLVSLS